MSLLGFLKGDEEKAVVQDEAAISDEALNETYEVTPEESPLGFPTNFASIGRIVHYNHPNGKTVAALITDIPKQTTENKEIEMCLFMKDGISFVNAYFSEEPRSNSWNWPPRA